MRFASEMRESGYRPGAFLAVYLTDGREVIVPISLFPEIKRLNSAQRKDWMVLDDQFFTFDAISKIYSVKDVLRV